MEMICFNGKESTQYGVGIPVDGYEMREDLKEIRGVGQGGKQGLRGARRIDITSDSPPSNIQNLKENPTCSFS